MRSAPIAKRAAEESAVDEGTPKMTAIDRLARAFGGFALGACLLAFIVLPADAMAIPSQTHPFEIIPGSFHITPSTNQAGAHANLVTHFDFAHNSEGETYNDVRTTIVNLPPGFLGNNTAMPTCTDAELIGGLGNTNSILEPECPPDTQVGQISFDFTFFSEPEEWTFPVYNMETDTGVTATLGFKALILTQILPISVRPGDSGLTITSPSIDDLGEIHNVTVTIWGVPAAPSHTAQRGEECSIFGGCHNGGEEIHIPVKPFLSNPTSCSEGPLKTTMKTDSWEEEENYSEETTEIEPMEGCERDPFHPSLKLQPTTKAAETPTGLNASLIIPQTYEDPETLATSHLKKAVVTLPEGFALNPSSGAGLGYCTPAQYEFETPFTEPGEAGCPSESKVGTIEVETPVLTEKALGSVYVAKPFDNPYDNLLTLYIVAKIPSRGIIVKAAGKVEANPVTGQLTTTIDNSPQVPFSKFTLKFNQGATSPLSSPATCGTFTGEADLSPWSEPNNPRHTLNSFEMTEGVHNGACPSGGIPAFHPGLIAGSVNNAAGRYSPFYVGLSREDGEQEITHFSIKLPPGMVGKLAGIPLCTDTQVAQAKAREQEGGAAEEEADPSCPAASEVGQTYVEAGVGTTLARTPGKIYLAGPYHGSATSVVSITDAKVGPFDLGTVVIREALRINPETGEVFVDSAGSDPLPHIVDGIPTRLRDIRIYMDRPEFVLNPTSCEPTSTASTVLGSGASFTNEFGIAPVTVSTPFQAAGCNGLSYGPNLALSLSGSTHRGGDPAFKATLTTHPGEANTGRAQVTLPRSEFLEQAHIGTVCTREVFNEGAVPGEHCPAASVYGKARAITPIISEPLEGPVYLRSNGGERKLPDLVAALHAGEINIDLVGYVEGVNGGIRNTFQNVPDAPVTSFTLEMEGGDKGLLVNSTNLCTAKHRATSFFEGHNGKIKYFKPLLAPTGCHKKLNKHRKHLAARHHRREAHRHPLPRRRARR